MGRWRDLVRILLALTSAASERLYPHDEPAQEFPSSCAAGLLEVSGKYLVASRIAISETCTLRGEAEVDLEAPIDFLGSVHLFGTWVLNGRNPFQQACMTVGGNLSVQGTATFRGCQNINILASGGALLVGGDFFIDDATLRFQDCRAAGHLGFGGGAHVKGWVRQSGGSVRFVNCHASAAAGALAAWGLAQTGGNMTFHNCSSRRDGGGLYVKDGGLRQSGGVLDFFGCSSGRAGGGAALKRLITHTGGTLAFWHCSSSVEAGGLLIEASMNWSDGLLMATNCTSKLAGGVSVRGALNVAGGVLALADCTADEAGGLVGWSLRQTSGTISAERCYALEWGSGMLLNDGDLVQEGGLMSFTRCRTEKGRFGGAVHVQPGGLRVTGGSMEFRHCVGPQGGGLQIYKDATIDGGSLLFVNCAAENNGGGLQVHRMIRHLSGTMSFLDCRAAERGGGIHTNGKRSGFEFHSGHLVFRRCSGLVGGGISVDGTAGFSQTGGTANFSSCTAVMEGGSFFCMGPLVQHGGMLAFRDSSTITRGGVRSLSMGGCVAVKASTTQSNGSMLFTNCSAGGGDEGSRGRGGGMYVVHDVIKSDGLMSFEDCSSNYLGGGASFGSVSITGGIMTFTSNEATVGGCVHLDGPNGWNQSGGVAAFRRCRTRAMESPTDPTDRYRSMNLAITRRGGGLSLERGNLSQSGGSLSFEDMEADEGGAVRAVEGNIRFEGGQHIFRHCTATKVGGCISSKYGSFFHSTTELSFVNCSAGKKGGAVWLDDGSFIQEGDAQLTFEGCKSGLHGGGVFVGRRLLLQNVSFLNDFAYGSGMAAFARQDAVIRHLRIRGSGRVMIAGPASLINISFADCSGSRQCVFLGLPAKADRLICHVGSGRAWKESEAGCVECDPGMLQLESGDASCVQCPPIAKQCLPDYLKMFPGYMVSANNPARVFHCPNDLACPGGDLPQKSVPMCAEGYGGLGCTECDRPAFGTADEDVMICSPCHSELWRNALRVSQLVLQDLMVFGLSAASMMGADASQRHSSIVLNQLLAFQVATDNVLASSMRTRTYQQLRGFIPSVADGLELGFGLSAGQGLSRECLLQFFGLPMTVFCAHVADCIVPVLAVIALAACKDSGLALAVGCNCFLPSSVAS